MCELMIFIIKILIVRIIVLFDTYISGEITGDLIDVDEIELHVMELVLWIQIRIINKSLQLRGKTIIILNMQVKHGLE